ncbi:THC0290_0291 family protein [Seonamhaeicola marinus]|uniref:Glutamate dehydrogenase n=1 Tax=Seonamhaeicola marinus TaxID=1912246 RepID=A0A5D0HRF8_9FLAO|nr:glutamate dehydrogenase [Seonamhaeicola marinus]TYA73914.1 glutamate dehydrogenase [Seonamhaeicola marinus]
MLNLKHLVSIFCLFFLVNSVSAQLGFSHEIGVVAGPLQFRSDFGSRNDSKTNFGNSGIGVGIVHYINFAYRADCNCYTTDTYFNDHFKLRNEISWNRTKLEHYGKWVGNRTNPDGTTELRNTPEANQLRGHTGVAQNFDIGTQLEFFPLSIRSFQSFGTRFAPYISLGVHYTSYTPEVKTTYDSPLPDVELGDVTDSRNFYSAWAPGSVNANPGSTWSVVSSVGVRYKVGRLADVVLDMRWQYYFSDWVDGLNHNLEYNKNNDWLVWVNFGYIIYLN